MTKLSGVLASLSETLDEFRADSAELEAEFFELVDEMSELGGPTIAAEAEPAWLDAIAAERLANLDRSITQQREEICGKQDRLADDVSALRDLVDQQLQLFAAWVKTTNTDHTNDSPKRGKKHSSKLDAPSKVLI